MMNLYYVFYYRIYKATYKTNKDVVEWTSMITLSALVFFNLISILALVYPQISKVGLNKSVLILGAILIMGINYYIFIFKRKYEKIIEDYSQRKELNSFLTGLITIIYILGSTFLMIYLLRRINGLV